MFFSDRLLALLFATNAIAYDHTFAFNQPIEHGSRTLDEIHQAALAEGDTVTLWHGGDEKNQLDGLRTAFEARFSGITLNLTIDVSKYHDGNID
jgi:hypothetical protein